jgi:membrane-associated phospholipid phosphatase
MAALVTAAALAIDPWVWRQVEYSAVYDKDWGRLLRVFGSLVLWFPLALAVWLERRRACRAVPVAPGCCSGVRRFPAGWRSSSRCCFGGSARGLHDGAAVFRAFSDQPFNTSALGMPSSHAMVAFAGAVVLTRLYPRVGPVAYAFAAGCALTRLLARAHFASDVVVGALAGWAVGALLWKRFGAHPSPQPS